MERGEYVYRFKNDVGEILYIGRTVDIEQRIKYHLGTAGLPDSFKEMASELEYIAFDTKADSYLAEIYYINKLKPAYNVQNKMSDRLNIEINQPKTWERYEGDTIKPTLKNETIENTLRKIENKNNHLSVTNESLLKQVDKLEKELKKTENMYIHVMRKILNIDEQKVNKIIELDQLEIK